MSNRQTIVVRSFPGSPFMSKDSLDDFRRAAIAFTKEATSSKKQALKVLRREGILNAKGKLTKRYS
jgi:hypothetical protein